jgi:hypothetical protein
MKMSSKEKPSMTAAPEPPTASTSADEPPAYQAHPEGVDPDEILEPAVFVIHGRFIYPVGASGEADSEPAYQLSRAIHAQGIATEKMTFERIDARVRTTSDGTPRLTKRAKELYELEHRSERPHLDLPFEAGMEPKSRRTLGKVSIQKSPLFHHGYRALKVISDEERRWFEKQGKRVNDGQYHFVIKEHGNAWQWSDPNGKIVATEVRDTATAEGDQDEYKLRVLVPLPRSTRDGLVALWCLWMWHIHVEDTKPKRTWEDRQLKGRTMFKEPPADTSQAKRSCRCRGCCPLNGG